MNAEKAAQLLKSLGAYNVSIGERWVKASCPFAAWTHHGGVDRTPSFGVSIEPTSRSRFNCFSCHKKGDLDTMMVELLHFVKQGNGPKITLSHAFSMVDQENEESYYDHGDWKEGGGPAVVFEAYPDWYLDAFPPALGIKAPREYLRARGMTDEEILFFDVRYDQFKQRVCFPYRNTDGELAGLRGRDIFVAPLSNRKPHFDYRFNGHSNIGITWFNEHRTNTNLPVIVVEGQFDAWSVSRVYPNVVACLSSGASYAKLDRLQYFPSVVICFDADDAGVSAADQAWNYLRKKISCHVVEYSKQQYKAKVDPGKLSLEELRVLLADYVTLD